MAVVLVVLNRHPLIERLQHHEVYKCIYLYLWRATETELKYCKRISIHRCYYIGLKFIAPRTSATFSYQVSMNNQSGVALELSNFFLMIRELIMFGIIDAVADYISCVCVFAGEDLPHGASRNPTHFMCECLATYEKSLEGIKLRLWVEIRHQVRYE